MDPCQSQVDAHNAALLAQIAANAALVAATAVLQQAMAAQAAALTAKMQADNLVTVTAAALQQCRNQNPGGGEMMSANAKRAKKGAA